MRSIKYNKIDLSLKTISLSSE